MKWIRNRYASYTPDGKFWLTIGVVCLVVDMAIGYMAGISQATFWHGVGAAMLAAGFAFLPDAAYEEFEQRRTASAVVLALICIPIGVKAYEQQLTYSAGMRHGEIKTAVVQNTRYASAQDAVKEESSNLVIWRDQKIALQKERELMVAATPWATTLTADALAKQIADLDVKIAEETKGGRGGRAKGCKQVCEQLKDERTNVEKQKAGIEKLDVVTAKIAELDARIASTQNVLDSKRKVASTTESKTSLNEEVAKTTAQLVKLMTGYDPKSAIETDDVSMRYATLGSAGLGSLALLIMAPVGFFLAGRRRRRKDDNDTPDHPVSDLGNRNPEPRAYQDTPQAAPPAPVIRPTRAPILRSHTIAQLQAMAA